MINLYIAYQFKNEAGRVEKNHFIDSNNLENTRISILSELIDRARALKNKQEYFFLQTNKANLWSITYE